MANTNNCSNTGSNCNTNTTGSSGYGKTSGNSSNWNGGSSTTATATCTETGVGTTWDVNNINAPGCYVCNWNGSLLRVSNACFDTKGTPYFTFRCSDPLTVTYLTNDPTATIETCRTIANTAHIYSNF